MRGGGKNRLAATLRGTPGTFIELSTFYATPLQIKLRDIRTTFLVSVRIFKSYDHSETIVVSPTSYSCHLGRR